MPNAKKIKLRNNLFRFGFVALWFVSLHEPRTFGLNVSGFPLNRVSSTFKTNFLPDSHFDVAATLGGGHGKVQTAFNPFSSFSAERTRALRNSTESALPKLPIRYAEASL